MRDNLFWLLFLLLTFIITLPISWWGLSKVNFFYSTLHDSIGINEHIQRYAPRNKFNKTGFEQTTKEERALLFNGVVTAIHNDGNGLESLAYTRASDKKSITLFTEAEVIHLKDVANLLNKLKPFVIALLVIWSFIILWVFIKRKILPSAKRFSLLTLILLGLVVLTLSLGPEKVFNQLHIWVFPDNHQWFFYYEDSLMSTMMKAPFLFAYISIIWAVISMMLTIIILKIMYLFQSSKRITNYD